MISAFDQNGIRFKYPENWRLEREETDSGWTVTVQSPGTAFWMLTLRADTPTPEALAEASLEALREEYPDLEADERFDTVAGQMAFGFDVEFFSLDLTNTCRLRSFFAPGGTALVMWQLSDLEWDPSEAVLRAITLSLAVDDE